MTGLPSVVRARAATLWTPDRRWVERLDPQRRWGAPEPQPAQCLEDLFALPAEHVHRRLPGRETFTWIRSDPAAAGASGTAPPGPARCVVKRFVGDAPRDVWFERLHRGRTRSPARREAENLLALAALGLPVPRPLLWVEAAGFGRRSALVMEHCAHEGTLADELAAAPAEERRRWVAPLAGLVARLHAAGWYHRDLYLAHWVLRTDAAPSPEAPTREWHPSPPQPLALLDLGRARHQARPRSRWLVKDLAAMAHSLGEATGSSAGAGPAERRLELRFLRAYLSRLGAQRFSRGGLRSWAHRVEAKRRRLAAHAPRHVFHARGESAPAHGAEPR